MESAHLPLSYVVRRPFFYSFGRPFRPHETESTHCSDFLVDRLLVPRCLWRSQLPVAGKNEEDPAAYGRPGEPYLKQPARKIAIF